MSIYAATHRYGFARIMNDPRLNKRYKKVALWNYFLTHEIQMGSQFIIAKPGGQTYMVRGDTGEIMALSRRGSEKWFAYFNQVYGLSEREEQTQFIYDTLRHYISASGLKAEVRRFAAYDKVSRTGYLSTYDGRMYRIDGSHIEIVPCGEDNIFFVDDDGGVHVDADIGDHGILLERLTNLNFVPAGVSGISPEQQKMAIIIWLFILAFPDVMPTKPLLIVEGAPGSGKSASLQLIQYALMGESNPMILQRNKEDDFGVVLLRQPIALFDNADGYVDWIPDAVCAYATHGRWTKRRLFTDDEQLIIKPQAFIAVASKNPASFRREDTVDRCIVIRLERRGTFRPFERLRDEILNERPQLLGEYLYKVGQIIDVLRQTADEDHEEVHRMADFASFGRAVGQVLGWDPEAVVDLMAALQRERNAFVNEEDPLVDLLDRWVNYTPRSGQRNAGRIVTIYQLHGELEGFASADGIPFKYSTRSLAQKLRSPNLESSVRVETIPWNNQKAYRIYRATDPKLEVV